MSPRALVVGGTGPTGPFLVAGLGARGYQVAILHRGSHESDSIGPEVEHIHTDPFDAVALEAALDGRDFDVVIATYGRMREVARVCAGRTERFVAVGGVPLYRGWMHPDHLQPPGLPTPLPEEAPLVADEDELRKGYRIRRSEEAVFELHPEASVFRYPMVYGPRQPLPLDWCVLRRLLDGRRSLVLADGGLTLQTAGYVENLAHAVLLAVDHPEAAAGLAFNCGDELAYTQRQRALMIAEILERPLEIVGVPAEVARPAWPGLCHERSEHRLMDLSRLRTKLGYRDLVPPREGLRRTVEWLVANPPEPGGPAEQLLGDPFDYAAEDGLIAAARAGLEGMRAVRYVNPPTAGASYRAMRNSEA